MNKISKLLLKLILIFFITVFSIAFSFPLLAQTEIPVTAEKIEKINIPMPEIVTNEIPVIETPAALADVEGIPIEVVNSSNDVPNRTLYIQLNEVEQAANFEVDIRKYKIEAVTPYRIKTNSTRISLAEKIIFEWPAVQTAKAYRIKLYDKKGVLIHELSEPTLFDSREPELQVRMAPADLKFGPVQF